MNRSRYPSALTALGAGYTATGIRTPALVPLEAPPLVSMIRPDPTPEGHYRLDDEVVYFVQAGDAGPIKIGYCNSESGVVSRIAGIQTGCPDKLRLRRLVAGGRSLETEYHLRFAASRMEGEWFLNTLEVAQEANAPDMKNRDPHRRLLPLLEKAFEAGERSGYAKRQLTIERLVYDDIMALAKEWKPDEEASEGYHLEEARYDLAELQKKAESRIQKRDAA